MSQGHQVLTRLRDATRSAVALPQLASGTIDMLGGYRIQRQALHQRLVAGEKPTGWKVALAGSAAQKRFNLNEPVLGCLTDAMAVAPGSLVNLARLIQPKLEIELAFFLGHTLVPGDYRDEDILAAVAEVAPAFEIADCRWQGWSFGVGAFLADNAAAGLYCLGPRVRFDHQRHASVAYRLESEGALRGAGSTEGRDDAPLINLCWLVRRLLSDGHAVEAGQIVLSGSLLAPMDIQAGEYRLHMLGTELALAFKARTG